MDCFNSSTSNYVGIYEKKKPNEKKKNRAEKWIPTICAIHEEQSVASSEKLNKEKYIFSFERKNSGNCETSMFFCRISMAMCLSGKTIGKHDLSSSRMPNNLPLNRILFDGETKYRALSLFLPISFSRSSIAYPVLSLI